MTAFCHLDNAKINNNEMESMLKLIIHVRNNSSFLKTQHGANITDIPTSIIATCQKNNFNVYHYLNNIQKHSQQVNKKPDKLMP